VQPFRYQSSWAWRVAPHLGAGLLAAAGGGAAGRALAAAALLSFDADQSGRSQWLARLVPAGEGANVSGFVPARGERRRTLVLVAHHDAAQTGFAWRHPAVTGVGAMRALGLVSEDEVPSFAGAPELGFALVALGPGRRVRVAGAVLLAWSLAASLDVARSETVPGASDNATGVAAVLALVERFAREPLDGVEVVALLPGCEESGMGGMAAWMRAAGARLDPATTLVLGLDTLGASEPVVLAAEGPPLRVRYRDADLALADRGAARAGLASPRRFTVGGWTDPVLARLAGLPAISLLSAKGGGLGDEYHQPSDTPERVNWDTVAGCTQLAAGIAEELSVAAVPARS
jgi:hypothetical protein